MYALCTIGCCLNDGSCDLTYAPDVWCLIPILLILLMLPKLPLCRVRLFENQNMAVVGTLALTLLIAYVI